VPCVFYNILKCTDPAWYTENQENYNLYSASFISVMKYSCALCGNTTASLVPQITTIPQTFEAITLNLTASLLIVNKVQSRPIPVRGNHFCGRFENCYEIEGRDVEEPVAQRQMQMEK